MKNHLNVSCLRLLASLLRAVMSSTIIATIILNLDQIKFQTIPLVTSNKVMHSACMISPADNATFFCIYIEHH